MLTYVTAACCLFFLVIALGVTYCKLGYLLFDKIRAELPNWVDDEFIYLFWPLTLIAASLVKRSQMVYKIIRDSF